MASLSAGITLLDLVLRMAEPYCLAMVLCDAIYRDVGTGKCSLLGTFSTVHATDFPARLHCSAYIAITDAQGPTTLSLKIFDGDAVLAGDGAQPISEFTLPDINVGSPLVVCELSMEIDTYLPKPGLYYCEIHAGSEMLMARRLLVIDAHGDSHDK